jgi:hypothetical protein
MNPMKAIDPGLMFDIDLEEQISLSKKKKNSKLSYSALRITFMRIHILGKLPCNI